MGLFNLSKNFLIVTFFLANFLACTSSSNDGSGSPEDYDLGQESNIPLGSKDGQMQDVNFAYDSSSLSDSSKQILKANAKWITQNKSKSVLIEGHCDERGTSDYNLALGERRAKSVLDYIKTLGVSEGSLSTVSYGSEIPLDSSHNEAAYAKNRRAHFSMKK
jgi:peptidoglycan-associated lipoprotein